MFAILPAAGHSRRMGQPKLRMPWRDQTVIEHVLSNWLSSRVDRVIITVRPDDEWLAETCRQWDVDVLVPPTAPLDMKESVQRAIGFVDKTYRPRDDDAWLLAPADMPSLLPDTINQVIAATAVHPDTILVPLFHGRNGHPVSIPWRYAREVYELGPREGVNAIVKCHPVVKVPVDDAGCLQDIDTPEQYRARKAADE